MASSKAARSGDMVEGEAAGHELREVHRERLTRVLASAHVITGGSSAFWILRVNGKVKEFNPDANPMVSLNVMPRLMVRADP